MACGTAPKVHIRPSQCEPEAGIFNIEYSGDDIDYTYSADSNSLDDEAFISDITVDAGEGFYQIAPHKEGDTLPNFTNTKERDDNGVSTQTEEIPFFIKSDSPDVRTTLNKLFGKVVDLRLTYNGDYEYKWEIILDVRLTSKSFDASRRGWSVTFKKVNPEVEAKLLFKTDFATTKALVASTAIA
jgi:hypothetical protein